MKFSRLVWLSCGDDSFGDFSIFKFDDNDFLCLLLYDKLLNSGSGGRSMDSGWFHVYRMYVRTMDVCSTDESVYAYRSNYASLFFFLSFCNANTPFVCHM